VTDLSHRFTNDSVSRALDLVGERWSLLILRESFFGVRRYGEFARNLSIPRPTLSARLKTLVDATSSAPSSRSCSGATSTSPGRRGRRSCCGTRTAARSPKRTSRVDTAVARSPPVG
jgi:hypothetical protein